METFELSTDEDEKVRPEPIRTSSIYMAGNWAYHAYKRSHDGQANVIFTPGGFRVHYGKSSYEFQHRFVPGASGGGIYWHPDNRRLAYFELSMRGKLAVVLDVRRLAQIEELGTAPPHKEVYRPPAGHMPYGLEWSPGGKALYVLEKFRDPDDRALYSRIMRVEIGSKKSKQIARMGGLIDFFMPPVSRFENGGGASSKRYWIVFGHATGLFLTDPQGKSVRRISQIPAMGLQNIEWSPKKNQLLLFFRSAAISVTGEKFLGVYLIHLDRIGRPEKGPAREQLYAGRDVHTLWYSPKGTYATWASPDAIYFRKPEAPPEETVKIVALEDEIEIEIKGVTWHQSEKKLAFTAGNSVYVYKVDAEDDDETKLIKIASFGTDTTHFTAEPTWDGNKVFMTVFRDLTREAMKRKRFHLVDPEEAEAERKRKEEAEKKAKASGPKR